MVRDDNAHPTGISCKRHRFPVSEGGHAIPIASEVSARSIYTSRFTGAMIQAAGSARYASHHNPLAAPRGLIIDNPIQGNRPIRSRHTRCSGRIRRSSGVAFCPSAWAV